MITCQKLPVNGVRKGISSGIRGVKNCRNGVKNYRVTMTLQLINYNSSITELCRFRMNRKRMHGSVNTGMLLGAIKTISDILGWTETDKDKTTVNVIAFLDKLKPERWVPGGKSDNDSTRTGNK